jgi:hypothetical protein
VIADLLAVHALGPSYYFAFQEVLAHGAQENKPSNSHPAPCFRLNMMLDELSHLGYLEVERSSSKGGSGQLNDPKEAPSRVTVLLNASRARVRAELPTTSYDGPLEVSHKTVEKYLDQLRVLVRAGMWQYSYTAEKYGREVPFVIESLVQGVAPIEARANREFQANSIQSILNGGWEVYKSDIQTFYQKFRDNVPTQERLSAFNQLLFKAVEASEVVRLWQKT